jgi:hypothetical protein
MNPALAAEVANKVAQEGKKHGKISENLSMFFIRLMNLDGENFKSLTGISKQVQVSSMAYIEDSLVNTEIAVPLMGTLNQIYLGYVLTALNIYNSIGRSKTLREVVGRVANEDISLHISEENLIDQHFGKANVSTEGHDAAKIYNIEDAVKHLATGRLIEFEFNLNSIQMSEFGGGGKDTTVATDVSDNSRDTRFEKDTDANGNVIRGDNMHEAGGTLKEKGDTTKTTIKSLPGVVKVPLYVSVKPVLLPESVAKAIFKLNFPMSLKRRWMQVKTREISFFKDFLLSLDLINLHKKALRADKNNVLSRFYNDKAKKDRMRIKSAIFGNQKNNLASSMIIISKETFDTVAKEAKLNFANPNDRQKFFNESYSMMLVVVDEMYEMCDIYYNGITQPSEMPYKAIKQGNTKSGVDMTEIMKTIAKGSAPRF